jgi:hypothetical protein
MGERTEQFESVTVSEIEVSEKKPAAYYQSRDSGVLYAWYRDDTVKIVESGSPTVVPKVRRTMMDFFRDLVSRKIR